MDATIQNGIALNPKSILTKVDTTPTADSNNPVSSDGVKTYVDQKDQATNIRVDTLNTQIAASFFFKGSSTFAELPASGNTVNDTYYVTDSDKECWYSWNGTDWIKSSMSQADYAGLIAQLKADISAEYSTSKTYKVGDYCLYGADGVLYICKIAVTTAGAFDSNKWQAISFGEAVGDLVIADDTQPTSLANKIWLDTDPNPDTVEVITEEDLGNIVAGEFDSASVYAVGDYCIHDAKLYVAKTATAANDGWIAARWQQVTVMGTINDQVGELKTHLITSGILILPEMTNGKAVVTNGTLTDQTNSAASDYISVIPHTVIYLDGLYLGGARAVVVYDKNKEKLAVAATSTSDTTLLYTIPEGGAYIRACAHVNGQITYAVIVSDTFGEILPYIDTVDGFVKLKESMATTFNDGGYIRYADGSIVSSQNYKYSDPFYITDGLLCVECTDDTPVAVIASTNKDGTEYTPLVAGEGTSLWKKYTYAISDAGYFCVSYRIANGEPNIWVERDGVTTILEDHKTAMAFNEFVRTPIAEIETVIEPTTWISGYVSARADNVITSSDRYKHSEPIFIDAGELTVKAAADTVVSVISKTNSAGTLYHSLVAGQSTEQVRTYTYKITEAGYYCITYRIENGVEIKLESTFSERLKAVSGSDSFNDVTVKNYCKNTIVPNWTIKAFKTLNYSDKTLPKYSQVLWNDPVEDVYYVSANLYSEKVKIFAWDYALAGAQSNMYQAVILPNGDVLFVYQTQFDHSTDASADGAYRKNPILYQAENRFTPIEIDFGDSLKPTGWLQNVGVHYSYKYNRLYISEYTRANEAYAHVWAVDMPVTTTSNWHVLLTKEILKPYGDGFKHFHTAQEDPFTNILYFSSGDIDSSSQVWYSTDGAATALEELDEPNQEKYRMLNMAFTEDYVYWASDQWNLSASTPKEHCLWKCSRNQVTGVLDVENGLTKILSFDDAVPTGQPHAWVATYATVFLPIYNALMFLDRDDHGEHASIPVRIYDIESGTLHTAGTVEDITGGAHQFGFRNVAVLCYPKDNEVAVSYDKNTVNYIKLLGNTNIANNKINNMILRVYKNGTSYKLAFDTVY